MFSKQKIWSQTKSLAAIMCYGPPKSSKLSSEHKFQKSNTRWGLLKKLRKKCVVYRVYSRGLWGGRELKKTLQFAKPTFRRLLGIRQRPKLLHFTFSQLEIPTSHWPKEDSFTYFLWSGYLSCFHCIEIFISKRCNTLESFKQNNLNYLFSIE